METCTDNEVSPVLCLLVEGRKVFRNTREVTKLLADQFRVSPVPASSRSVPQSRSFYSLLVQQVPE